MSAEKRMKLGLFRFGVIAPLVCRRLEEGERQALRAEIGSQRYEWPEGVVKPVGVRTLARWLSRYRSLGFDGLLDIEKATSGHCRGIAADVLLAAEQLRRELPSRSVQSIISILKNEGRDTSKLAASTLSRQLKRRGATKQRLTSEPGSYQRWQQAKVNDMWQADVAHGIWLPDPKNPKKARKCKLIAFIDDASRIFTHAQFYYDEQLPSLIDCFRKALLKRGKPRRLLFDNGMIFHATTIKEICAQLGIEISFCQPYSPASKGKIERGLGSIKSRFYPEAEAAGITSLAELNEFFFAWLTKEYHHKIHGGLSGLTPVERLRQDESLIERVTVDEIKRAMMLKATRRVNVRTATILLGSKTYQASTALAGETVEVRWQANKDQEIEIWLSGKCIEIAKRAIVGVDIDFSRKPSKLQAGTQHRVLSSAKAYRRALAAGRMPAKAADAGGELLAMDEFIDLTARVLERHLTEAEQQLLNKCFCAVAPISAPLAIEALNLAVRAKGKNLHLRFYCHHLEETVKQSRS